MRHETPLSGLRADIEAKHAELDALADLDKLIGYIARNKQHPSEALAAARANNAAPRIVNTLQKAATEAATTGAIGVTLGSEFGTLYSQARNTGAADMMYPFAVQMPQYLNSFVLMSAVTASTVSEGSAKPNRRLLLSAVDVTPSKGSAMVTASKELLDGVGSGLRAIRQELLRSLIQWTDGLLLTNLSGNSSESSGGDSFDGFISDLRELAQLVGVSAQSRLFLVVPPASAKASYEVRARKIALRGFDPEQLRATRADDVGSRGHGIPGRRRHGR